MGVLEQLFYLVAQQFLHGYAKNALRRRVGTPDHTIRSDAQDRVCCGVQNALEPAQPDLFRLDALCQLPGCLIEASTQFPDLKTAPSHADDFAGASCQVGGESGQLRDGPEHPAQEDRHQPDQDHDQHPRDQARGDPIALGRCQPIRVAHLDLDPPIARRQLRLEYGSLARTGFVHQGADGVDVGFISLEGGRGDRCALVDRVGGGAAFRVVPSFHGDLCARLHESDRFHARQGDQVMDQEFQRGVVLFQHRCRRCSGGHDRQRHGPIHGFVLGLLQTASQ